MYRTRFGHVFWFEKGKMAGVDRKIYNVFVDYNYDACVKKDALWVASFFKENERWLIEQRWPSSTLSCEVNDSFSSKKEAVTFLRGVYHNISLGAVKRGLRGG